MKKRKKKGGGGCGVHTCVREWCVCVRARTLCVCVCACVCVCGGVIFDVLSNPLSNKRTTKSVLFQDVSVDGAGGE